MQTNIARKTRANEAGMELETRATGEGAEKNNASFFSAPSRVARV